MTKHSGLSEDDRAWIIAVVQDKIEHLASSPQTKESINEIKVHMERIEEEQKNKIGTKMFMWIIGILMTIILAVSGYIVNQISSFQEKAFNISVDIAEINGALKNAQFTTHK